jgi:mannose-1-phosphate guanylyltransferase
MGLSEGKLKLNAVIMCGGSGTRFWPASRRSRPKQFLRLAGESSLIQDTVSRLEGLAPSERVYLLAAEEHRELLSSHLPQVPPENYILEPAPRNTGPALALAARFLEAKSPSSILAALPSDHSIADNESFLDCLRTAAEAASTEGVIATIGIKPDSPETGYGYIEIAEEAEGAAYPVRRFVEKPDLETASLYCEGGRHLWNAGIFVTRADTMAAQFREHQPMIWQGLWENLPDPSEEDFVSRLAETYPELPKISIDYAVMEKAKGVVCVPGDFGWNDLGSWKALEKLWNPDGSGNYVSGGCHAVDSRGNIVAGDGREIALIGVDNLVVVERDDVVLVCAKERCQEVRKLAEQLEKEGREDLL